MSYAYPETLELPAVPSPYVGAEALANWLESFAYARIGTRFGAVELHYGSAAGGQVWHASVRVKRSGRGSHNQTRYCSGQTVDSALYKLIELVVEEFVKP